MYYFVLLTLISSPLLLSRRLSPVADTPPCNRRTTRPRATELNESDMGTEVETIAQLCTHKNIYQ